MNTGRQAVARAAPVVPAAHRPASARAAASGPPPRALLQAKLRVSEPHDPLEREADRVADQVMRMPQPALRLQRKCACGAPAAPLAGECEECRRSKPVPLQRTAGRAGGEEAREPAAPGSVHEALALRGDGLAPSLRTFYETRFGHDFSGVRIHTGPAAERSARDVRARAYTVGRDIVFASGEYAPASNAGRRLLAHELAHVVQQSGRTPVPQAQGTPDVPCVPLQAKLEVSRADDPLEREADEVADRIMRMPTPGTGGGLLARGLTGAVTPASPGPMLQRQEADAAVEEDPECDTSETNPVLWFEHDSTRLRVDGSVDSTVHLRSLIERVRGHDAASAGTGRVELRGFASAEGDAPHNLDLSRRRAERVRELLAEAGIASGRVSAVGLGESNSMPGREWNRRVEVCLTPRVETIDMPPEVVTAGVDCAHPPAAVTDLTDYAMLVTCVERALPTLTPRDILTLLRQTYYRGGHWPEVIGCATPAGSAARGTLRTSHRTLYDTLAASKVVSGVDLGHVFTGLEAMVCPTPDVEIEIPGPNVIVAMPNEEFATWGGDLGSAAASRTHDEVDLGVTHTWSHYFGTAGAMASFEDLRGDIDAFALRAELAGHCGATRMTTLPSVTTPISHLLLNYYGPGPSLTAADRFRCTVEALGGTAVGGAITNKSALVSAMTPRVESFARTFYLSLVTVPLFAIGPVEAILLRRYSREASALFVDWLETGL